MQRQDNEKYGNTINAGKVTKVFLSLNGAFVSLFWLFPSIISLNFLHLPKEEIK